MAQRLRHWKHNQDADEKHSKDDNDVNPRERPLAATAIPGMFRLHG
jgi:hypothetical protein